MRFGEDSFGILEKISDAVFVLDGEWRFLYANPVAEQVLSGSREEVLGKPVWEELPEFVGSTLYREYRESIGERVTVEFEKYWPPLETWFEITASPLEEVGLLVYLRDIKERKRAEKDLREY